MNYQVYNFHFHSIFTKQNARTQTTRYKALHLRFQLAAFYGAQRDSGYLRDPWFAVLVFRQTT